MGGRIMKSKFYILILLIGILILGCATPRMYEGPRLPKDQVATVEGSITAYLGVWFLATVLTCDLRLLLLWPNSYITFEGAGGSFFDYFKYYRGNPPKIEVLPGYNEIYVNLYKEALIGYLGPVYHREYRVWLKFNAEAGHKYKVKAPFLWKEGSIVRLVDVDSGEVAASERFR
jgi:hypothetical protein